MTTAAPAHERLWFLDTLVIVRVSPGHSAGGISILESRAAYGDGPPLHVHRREDEAFHVLDGELELVVGDQRLRAGTGETLLAPQDIPHTYRVTSNQGARWLIITPGSNFERFVRTMSRPAETLEIPRPAGPPTPEQAAGLAATAREHGIDLIGPPLPASLATATIAAAPAAGSTHR